MSSPERLGFPEIIRHYRLERVLGSGGMGSVVEGTDRRDGSRVAIKLLHSHLAASDASFRERFEHEAHVVALLRSPYTVHLIDFGVQDGLYFLVMEFVEGQSVADLLKNGPIEPTVALRIASETGRALEEAAARGIVHRDIKPENLLLDADGRVKVADFGIAKQTQAPGLTAFGGFVGTPTYAAPEQSDGVVDQRTDIYQLGGTLYHMLTGRTPFPGGSLAELREQHRDAPVPLEPLSTLPRGVATVVTRALEKDPLDRYQSPTEMVGAIDRARNALSRQSQPGTPLSAAGPSPGGSGNRGPGLSGPSTRALSPSRSAEPPHSTSTAPHGRATMTATPPASPDLLIAPGRSRRKLLGAAAVGGALSIAAVAAAFALFQGGGPPVDPGTATPAAATPTTSTIPGVASSTPGARTTSMASATPTNAPTSARPSPTPTPAPTSTPTVPPPVPTVAPTATPTHPPTPTPTPTEPLPPVIESVFLVSDPQSQTSTISWVFHGDAHGLEDRGFHVDFSFNSALRTFTVAAGSRQVTFSWAEASDGQAVCKVAVAALDGSGSYYAWTPSNDLGSEEGGVYRCEL
ncbi:MAG: protein kinase [Dehalococcoidia bacterium]